MTLKTQLKEAVDAKLASSKKLRDYKAAPWAPEDVHSRAYEIARQREYRTDLRASIRYLHLAYAFSRGRPYKQQEPNVREGNEPLVSCIHSLLTDTPVSYEQVAAWYKNEPLELPATSQAAE